MSELMRHVCAQESELGRHGRRNRRKDWTTEDLRRLRELAASGAPLDTIAATLRRTASAIRNKAGMQGISLRRNQ